MPVRDPLIPGLIAVHRPLILNFPDTASPDDPNEISFTKNEIMDIVDKQGKWWHARKADGTVGSAYFCLVSLVRSTDFWL